jgi:transaldolase
MHIFIDSAHVPDIKELVNTGIVTGVTTNPTFLAQEKESPKTIVQEIARIVPGDVSVEVTETEPNNVYNQAHAIAKIAPNIVVKIPCHEKYYVVIKKLVTENIRINATLVFSIPQGLYMSLLGVTYISPFVGRLDDQGEDGSELVFAISHTLHHMQSTSKLLAASIRTVEKFEEVIAAGADIVTLPVAVFRESLTHPLTDQGMKKFTNDWKKTGVTQFP